MKYYTSWILLSVALFWVSPASAQVQDENFVPDFRHMKIDNPAALTDSNAEAIYHQIQSELAKTFARSELPVVKEYNTWKRYNRAPYLSSTHGDRYINNFANDLAVRYDALAKGYKMPAGAVFAKDGFAVTKEGDILPGRLFVMEKLAEGASPGTGDWRYLAIESDGSLIGDSQHDAQNALEFCHICHKVRSSRDFLFFVPPGYRN